MKPKKIKVGDVFQLNGGGSCTVIEYLSWDKIRIRHNDSHCHEMTVQASHLRRGGIRNPYQPSVYGVGFVGVGPHLASESRVQTPEYNTWSGMMQRSYDPKLHARHPSYKGVSVCSEWHNFQNFAGWMKAQKNAYREGFHLDKDLTIIDNKVYSPCACSFVPARINSLVTDRSAARGSLPVGVVFKKRDNKYYAQMNIDGVMRHISIHDTPEDAFLSYKAHRKNMIRRIAEEYKDSLSEKVYKNLSEWTVNPF